MAEEKDHVLAPERIEDFYNFTGMAMKEGYEALDELYNKELFEKNEFGQWRLKKEYIEERRNPYW